MQCPLCSALTVFYSRLLFYSTEILLRRSNANSFVPPCVPDLFHSTLFCGCCRHKPPRNIADRIGLAFHSSGNGSIYFSFFVSVYFYLSPTILTFFIVEGFAIVIIQFIS